MPEILIEQRGQLGLLTLNRPAALNALNAAMVRTLLETLLAWREDPAVGQVAITGTGSRGFCAGGDIVAIYRDIAQRDGSTEEFWRIEYQLNALIDEYPKPFIALMDGIVLGGGIGISAHGSHRIATERTRCGMPETGIGFFPDVGGTHLLATAPRAAGRLAALTGRKFGAADAMVLGLVDCQVPADSLPAVLDALEAEPVDQVLRRFAVEPEPGFLDQQWVQAFETESLAEVFGQLEASPEPEAAATLAALSAACPSAVRLADELLRRAGASLREDLGREFRAAVHRLDDPDFAEGIRAAVIDKDRTPQWTDFHAGMSHELRTARHFAPLPGAELNFALLETAAREGAGA